MQLRKSMQKGERVPCRMSSPAPAQHHPTDPWEGKEQAWLSRTPKPVPEGSLDHGLWLQGGESQPQPSPFPWTSVMPSTCSCGDQPLWSHGQELDYVGAGWERREGFNPTGQDTAPGSPGRGRGSWVPPEEHLWCTVSARFLFPAHSQ